MSSDHSEPINLKSFWTKGGFGLLFCMDVSLNILNKDLKIVLKISRNHYIHTFLCLCEHNFGDAVYLKVE